MISLIKLMDSILPKKFDRTRLGSCMIAVEYAMNFLLNKNIKDFKVVEGWVSLFPNQEQNEWTTHTWIELKNGKILDLTKKQFKNWGVNPENIQYKKIKRKYNPQEYLELCNKYPSTLTPIKIN